MEYRKAKTGDMSAARIEMANGSASPLFVARAGCSVMRGLAS